MGLISSGDKFCARTERALAGNTGVFKLVDNILIYVEDHAQLLSRIRTILQLCLEGGITLSKMNFTVITDHQPLLGILNRKNLDAINNVRIQSLMAKLLGYRVEY